LFDSKVHISAQKKGSHPNGDTKKERFCLEFGSNPSGRVIRYIPASLS